MIERPLNVTIFAWMVLIIAIFNLTRFFQAIIQKDFLLQYLFISPIYLVLSGLIWGGVFLLFFWGLWIGAEWVMNTMSYLIVVYAIYFWLDREFVGNMIYKGANQYFMIIVTIVLLLWTYSVFFRGRLKRLIGDKN